MDSISRIKCHLLATVGRMAWVVMLVMLFYQTVQDGRIMDITRYIKPVDGLLLFTIAAGLWMDVFFTKKERRLKDEEMFGVSRR
ncbi:hypothetical protein B0H94_105127 [Salsuginibacillus halophilus]|uniref:Uncharacterized protein n=1 Tax=Salsuginibacillus halophilus TaxID=517424 RepID=A0A2P8HL77_9BACI|nr:hypothetical protein [Salsuginibacillus halophilus]PSL46974.1 hypothetical protein B0H94_105127 [Salsuginibacillus halophilus]